MATMDCWITLKGNWPGVPQLSCRGTTTKHLVTTVCAASDKDNSSVSSKNSSRYSALNKREFVLFSGSMPLLFTDSGFLSSNIFNEPVTYKIGDDAHIKEIKNEIRKVLSKARAAGLLRLVFHDAGTFNLATNTGGMNGSIIYELQRPANAGLTKPVKILKKVKEALDTRIPVSWADLIVMAGAEAVAICGGPQIPVKLGRLDTGSPDPDGELPSENSTARDLKLCFSKKGFLVHELVALSGAHTIGSKGFGNPNVFDNSYFNVLLEQPWTKSSNEMGKMIGLPSDRALIEDEECLRYVTEFAKDQELFFSEFSKAYIKLANSGAQWRVI